MKFRRHGWQALAVGTDAAWRIAAKYLRIAAKYKDAARLVAFGFGG